MSFLIYLIGVLNLLDIVRVFLGVVLMSVTILGFIGFAIEEDFRECVQKRSGKIKRYAIIIFLFMTLIPDAKTVAAMCLVPKIVASKPVNDIGDKTLKVLNLKLDEWIKDLAGEK